MIDLHSHILPKMDDGSSDVQETMRMLRESARQGVEVMAATPHFYAHRENPGQFLRRREESFKQIACEDSGMPVILLGAEVAYFNGMSGCEALRDMRIGQSDLLLVEMPFANWTGRMVDEVCSLREHLGVIPVLAHVNRYPDKSLFPRYQEQFRRSGVLFQCNAEAFVSFLGSKKAADMLKKQGIHFLGSDCHNMNSRPPKLGDAAQKISSRLGGQVLDELDMFAARMLGLSKNEGRINK